MALVPVVLVGAQEEAQEDGLILGMVVIAPPHVLEVTPEKTRTFLCLSSLLSQRQLRLDQRQHLLPFIFLFAQQIFK